MGQEGHSAVLMLRIGVRSSQLFTAGAGLMFAERVLRPRRCRFLQPAYGAPASKSWCDRKPGFAGQKLTQSLHNGNFSQEYANKIKVLSLDAADSKSVAFTGVLVQ